jgi:hypothetical protein
MNPRTNTNDTKDIFEGLPGRPHRLDILFVPTTGAMFQEMQTIASYSWRGDAQSPVIAVPGLYHVEVFL